MNARPLHLALREWRRQMRSPRVWAVLAAMGLGLAIVGPFGVGARLTPPGRFAYWFAIAAGSYALGLVVHLWLERRIRPATPAALRILAAGLATGLAVLPLVTAANVVTFGNWPDAAGWAELVPQVLGVSLVVSLVFHLLEPSARDPASATGRAPLLDRLPPPKRGALLALSAQDHYTEVRSSAGTELILIRLGDAIREAAPTEGLRVHRSHWVARAAITGARRDGDRAILTLVDGAEIPVSRANVPGLRAAGLL